LFVLSDQSNVVAIVDPAGAIQERYGYNAYGTALIMTASFVAESNSAFNWENGFCGYLFDMETGFYQVRYRYYHATLGIWLTRDPLANITLGVALPAVGQSTNMLDVQSGGMIMESNIYQYAASNPINIIDPLGLDWSTAGQAIWDAAGYAVSGSECPAAAMTAPNAARILIINAFKKACEACLVDADNRGANPCCPVCDDYKKVQEKLGGD